MLNISDNFKDTKKVDRILESSLDFQFFLWTQFLYIWELAIKYTYMGAKLVIKYTYMGAKLVIKYTYMGASL